MYLSLSCGALRRLSCVLVSPFRLKYMRELADRDYCHPVYELLFLPRIFNQKQYRACKQAATHKKGRLLTRAVPPKLGLTARGQIPLIRRFDVSKDHRHHLYPDLFRGRHIASDIALVLGVLG